MAVIARNISRLIQLVSSLTGASASSWLILATIIQPVAPTSVKAPNTGVPK